MIVGGAGVVGVAVAGPEDGRQKAAAEPVDMHSVKLKDTGRGKKGVDRRGTETFSLVGISWPTTAAQLEGRAEIRTRSAATGEWSAWQELGTDIEAPVSAEGDEDTARGATEPRWVGPSDGVEARVVADDGTATAGLPRGLRLDMVDPGVTRQEARRANRSGQKPPSKVAPAEAPGQLQKAAFAAPANVPAARTNPSPGTDGSASAPASPVPSTSPEVSSPATTAPAQSPSASTSSSPTAEASPTGAKPAAPESTVTRPPIVSRAEWGADESKVEEPSAYIDRIDAVFVHHTAGENGYSCAQSPAIVRALMMYHIESNGWNDLGYNFVVDKCGTIYEGRSGGTDLPVHGAHTLGFNSYSTGVAVIGNFENDGKTSARITNAVARLAGWKLGQYGGDPQGKVTLEALADTGVWNKGDQATLHRVSGHSDAFATACPGDALYAQLGEIRRFAASPAASSAAPTADIHHDGIADMLAGTPDATRGGDQGAGMVSILPGAVNGPVPGTGIQLDQSSPGVAGSHEDGDHFGEDSAYGDINGDGHADLVVGLPGEEWADNPADHGVVSVLYGPDLDSGTTLLAPVADRTAGARFGSGVEVADVDSDGRADVVVASPGAPGRWFLYDGETLEFTQSGLLNSSPYTGDSDHPDLTSGDFDRDGYVDIAVTYRDPEKTGRVLVLQGSADGLEPRGVLATLGGRSVATGDTDRDGYADLVIGQPYVAESDATSGGQITVLRGSAGGLTTDGKRTLRQDSSGIRGGSEAGDAFGYFVSAGDVNNDNYVDVLVGAPRENLSRGGENRVDAGMVHLLYGGSNGLSGSGSQAFHQDDAGIPGATESYDRFSSSVQLADVSGWGRTDLAIGEDGENDKDGGVTTIPAGSGGISQDAALFYHPGDFGMPGGSRLGWTLTP